MKILNATTGAVLFYDNLEQDTAGTQPDTAHPGFWTSVAAVDVVHTGASAGGPSGAFEGALYLRTQRTANDVGNAYAHVVPQSTPGHQIQVEFMMYLPSGSDAAPVLTGDDQLYRCLFRAAGGRVFYYNGSSFQLTGALYTANTWQKWVIGYTIGASTCSISVDGSSGTASTLADIATPGGGGVGGFLFAHNALNSYYIDSAVQPAPPNNVCASAIDVTSGSVVGYTLSATSDGSATCGNSAGNADVWYRYTATCTGELSLNLCGTSYDTLVSVHGGCPGTTLNELACNDNCGGSPCSGNASCLALPVTTGGIYYIRVSGSSGAKGYFTLNTRCSPPPENDACASARPIVPGPTTTGTTLGASTDGSASCDVTSGADVWYSYVADYTGTLNVNTCGSAFNTVLSVHTGCPGTSANEAPGACNTDCAGTPCGGPGSCLTMNVISGETYYIRVAGAGGEKGDFSITLSSPPVNDSCAAATIIGNETVTGSTLVATNDGSATCGDAAASPDAWYAYTATCTGDLSVRTCGSGFDTVLSVHSGCPGTGANELIGACNDDCTTLCGGPASCLTVPVIGGSTYFVRVAGAHGARGPFTLTTSCTPAPPNDACGSATAISDGSREGTTLGSGVDGSSTCGSAGGGDVWYVYTATCNGDLQATTCGSSLDTQISVHSGCPGTTMNELGCNDNCGGSPCTGSASCVRVPVASGGMYYIRVSGTGAAKGDFTLNTECRPPNPPGALTVTNVTTGNLLFSDDFEDAVVGNVPTATGPGNWTGVPVLDVVATGGVPGAFEGVNYLSSKRTSTAVGNPQANFAAQTTPGDMIHAEFMMYLPTGTDSSIVLVGDNTFYRGLFRPGFSGDGTVGYYDSTAYVLTELTYEPNTWQKWEVDYAIGAPTYRVTVNCASITVPALNGISQLGGGGMTAISFAHNATATYYVDAVKPPSNDACADATPITEGLHDGTTTNATSDGSAACGNPASPDVWYRYTASCTGPLKVSTCGAAFDTVVSVHAGDTCPGSIATQLGGACNDNCDGTPCAGPASCVTVPSVAAGSTYLIRVAGVNGATGCFTLTVTCGPPPANDFCSNATPVGNGSFLGTTLQAGGEGDASCGSSISSADVYYAYTNSCSGAVRADTIGSSFNTVLSVHSACPAGTGNQLACSDDAVGTDARVIVTGGVPGQVFIIRVAGFKDAIGNFRLNIGCAAEICDNSEDDDGDTLVDCADPDCALTSVCSGCKDPFADHDGDGDVDMDDFGAFQQCFSGRDGGIAADCTCFNRDGDNDVDTDDFLKFRLCESGPELIASPVCDD